MTSRRVRNIAARKKQDTLFGSISTSLDGPGAKGLLDGTTMFLYNATYRQYQNHTMGHVRNTSTPYYVGIKDRVLLTSVFPYTHRRVCFWSYQRFGGSAPLTFQNPNDAAGPHIQRRYLNPLDDTSNGDTLEYLFKGTLGVDYSKDTRAITPLDDARLKIVYDRTTSVNPALAAPSETASYGGKITAKKFWHPIRRTVQYDEDEDGASIDQTEPGWAAPSPNSPGNFYILDIFSTGIHLDTPDMPIGSFMPETTVYWHETA